MKVKNSKSDPSSMHSNESMNEHVWFMRMALEQAEQAWRIEEVPIGAVVVDPKGEVLARTHNLKESTHNACGHAEILALQEAAKKIETWRLVDCKLYVTLEPCPMCLAALGQARIGQVIFGAYDPKGGSISLGYTMHRDVRLNHRFAMLGGILHYECSRMLSQFFKERRPGHSVASHNT
jgi:tRNA(adenine34) deaminase